LPQARILYGFQLVENGFVRPANRHDPNGEALQRSNGLVFEKAWAGLQVARSDACSVV
jgi:hypothetical protein